MVHDEKRLWTSADWLANTGRGVIKAQVSYRSSCAAGRSAAEGDETIAATHAKTKEIVGKKFLGILLPPCLAHGKNTVPERL